MTIISPGTRMHTCTHTHKDKSTVNCKNCLHVCVSLCITLVPYIHNTTQTVKAIFPVHLRTITIAPMLQETYTHDTNVAFNHV